MTDDERLDFDTFAERMDQGLDTVAEALRRLDKTIDRAADGIRAEMRRGFAETQAIIQGLSKRAADGDATDDRPRQQTPHRHPEG
jgi:hypothetical protein